jgi:hypothetical protein
MYFDAEQTAQALGQVERHRQDHEHPGLMPLLVGLVTGWWLRGRSSRQNVR